MFSQTFFCSSRWGLALAALMIAATGSYEVFGQEARPESGVTLKESPPATLSQAGAPATTGSLRMVRLFPEPPIPAGREPSDEENQVLASVLQRYAASRDLSELRTFVEANPASPWRVSILTNLGLLEFDAGYFSRALADWTLAWNIGKAATDLSREADAIVVRALAEALKMNCRVGRVAEAKALLAELGERPLSGLNATMIDVSRKAVVQMEMMPKDCFKCGPFALSSILAHDKKHTAETMGVVTAFPTTAQGTSLAQVKELANTRLGMQMQAAKRLTADAPILHPSVINWKLNHYGALLKKEDERYLMADPTFGTSQWIGADAINQESSGYFLVPAGPLPQGWAAVDDAEAATVWGRGDCAVGDGNGTGKNDPKKGKGGGCGMAGWSIHHSLASLNIEDIPLFYDPAAGPAVRFRVNYSQLEQNQPTTINFSNIGALWNFSWVSYLTFDSANARARMGEGGTELYTNFNGSTGTYSPDQSSHARLVRVAADNYERRQSDGSKMVFNLPDGTGRLFATQIVDAQGNALTLAYDANFRLVSLTDAVGQVTTLTHGSNTPGDPLFYLVTKVTDPFGRFATLAYDASRRLTSLTDQIGITSLFTYTASNLVHTLTTPYGTTTFDCGNASLPGKGVVAHVQVTEPDGSQQRVESCQYSATPASDAAVPTGMPLLNLYLNYRNSYYWDAKAMLVAPGDYTKANLTHFLHLNASNIKANVAESEKNALESRVWYFYHNQNLNGSIYTNEGMGAHPTHIGRLMDDGSTQLYQYEYNDLGNMTKSIDPLGRTVVYTYAANGIDLLSVKRVKAQGGEDVLATFSYNSQHQPATITKPSGETLSFTYNARGQATSATNARGDTSTYTYNALGQLTMADGPLPGTGDQCTFTYDAEGRVDTMTRDGYTINLDHDALNRLTRVTYPDGTYEQVTYTHLDPTQVRDRAGRTTTMAYSPVRQLISVTDPLSRVVKLEWCTCGSLRRMIDPLGRITAWDEDLQGRTISKTFPNHTRETYVYEATNSRLAKITDGLGQSKTFAYNLDDSVASLGYSGTYQPTPGVSYVYDAAYPRQVSMTDGQGVTTYSYGAPTAATGANQLKEVKTLWDGVTVAYAYDKLGRVQSRSVNGVAQSFTRDAGGRTTSLTNPLGTFGFTFDGATSRITGVSLPNGQSVVASYFGTTGHRRLQQLRNVQPNAATLSQFDLTYNSGGEILSWNQQSGAGPAQNYNLSYDAARQLTSMNAAGRDFSFSYDSAGNLKTKTLNGSTTSFSHNVLNELQSASPALGDDKTYVWDGENRLAGIGYTGTSRFTRFKYDGLGRCVEISEHEGFTVTSVKRFVWSRLERVEERDGSGNVTRRFFAQGEQIGGVSCYYSFDHLGSVREMTDASGTVRARYDYDPYGVRTKVAGDLDAAKGFTGHYYHAPSGLHLTMFRAYDARTGRWLSRDPLAENAGFNLYAYVRNGPVNAVDPLGMIDAWGFGTAALGAAGGMAGMAAGGAVMLAGSAATVTIPLAGQVGGPAAVGLGFGAATLGAVNTKRNLENLAAAWNDQPAPSKGGVFADAAEALAPGNGAAAAVGIGLDMATGGMAGGVAEAAHGTAAAAKLGEQALKHGDEAMAGLGAAASLGGIAKDNLGGDDGSKSGSFKPTPHPRGALPGQCLK